MSSAAYYYPNGGINDKVVGILEDVDRIRLGAGFRISAEMSKERIMKRTSPQGIPAGFM